MEELENKQASLLKEVQTTEDILGFFWGGSRGKDQSFLTENSDVDAYVIVSDDASEDLKERLKNYQSEWFEIRVFTLLEFTQYGEWGSGTAWDRYNFAHNKAVVDKTGQIQILLNEKGKLPESARRKLIEESLDSYFNQVYRSAKYWRDGKDLAAHLDAAESLPHLMTALYALEGRLKPYNKYFEWELTKYPLTLLPWSPEEFISDYRHILETGDIKTQEKIFKAVKQLFLEQSFKERIGGWKGYYFVGE